MPLKKASFQNQSRSLDARPDRYDVRDRKYQPRLLNLPDLYPDPAMVKAMLPKYRARVLDQGEEGACTGFGLAVMVNFLRFREYWKASNGGRKKVPLPPPVSTRMLYEHARLYDEWAGEDYEGSSCRGAMKGWHRHGVCLERTWPYKKKNNHPGKPLERWRAEAAKITLGAYYRVETDDVTALQSAIYEVGAVYVSADVHSGWDIPLKQSELPVIQWQPGFEINGGHAFALVGFRSDGFIIQNSWGSKWGTSGFAVITYDDWLVNATDAWVAALGVPRLLQAVPANIASESSKALPVPATKGLATAKGGGAVRIWSEDEARDHSMVLGNDGVLLRSSAAYDPNEFVNKVLMNGVRDWMKSSPTNRRVVVYAHGGLNSEEAGIKRARIMGPSFKANGVFPIFVVWKTGWKESLISMADDVLGKLLPDRPSRRSGGLGDLLSDLGDKVGDGWDYTVEASLGFLGKSLWRQMKQNAAASGTPNHGGDLLAQALVKLSNDVADSELHLVGHSAGSIWNGCLLTKLRSVDAQFKANSCHLFAAACTVPFANLHYGEAIAQGTLGGADLWFHNLSDGAERGDNVGGFYRKSLLYFVSRASEEAHKMPILGMEAAWNSGLDRKDIFHDAFNADVTKWRELARVNGIPKPLLVEHDDSVNDGIQVHRPSHGGFDNDIAVMSRTIVRILGLPPESKLPQPIQSLAGF